ncbi:MAG: HlyD family efflux transporter periplasmic adaptor subunit [Gemmatimonadaceae bacterium]
MNTTRKNVLLIACGVVLGAAVSAAVFVSKRPQTARNEEAQVAAPSRTRTVPGPLGAETAVALDSETLSRAGIETHVLGAATRARTMTLTGELVAEPGRIASIRSAVAGRVSAAGGHWPSLGEHVAAGTVLAQVSDAAPLAAPRTGVVTALSVQPGEMVQAGQQLLELTDFSELLARIVWRPTAPRSAPEAISVSPLGAPNASATARLVGPAADVDSLTRAPVYLYRTRPLWPGARPGAPLMATVTVPGAAEGGVLIPTDAVVQWGGLSWVFVRHTGEAREALFVRRRVDTSEPVHDGWLVHTGGATEVSAGDTVVVRGAQLLLSEEFRSRTGGGEEDEGGP